MKFIEKKARSGHQDMTDMISMILKTENFSEAGE